MEITFDPAADAIYIRIRKAEVRKTEVLDKYETMIDIGRNGSIVGIEMLGASKRLPHGLIKDLKSRKTAEAPIRVLDSKKN